MISIHAQCRLTGLFWGQKRIYVTNMQESCPTNIDIVVNEGIVNSTTNRGQENEPALIPRKSYSLKFVPGTVGLFQPSVFGEERTQKSAGNRAKENY